MVEIGIIVGSTREGRFGIQPARFLYDIAAARGDATPHLLDLQEYPLPHFGEPAREGMKVAEWQETIAQLDGFLFVTPEYNHSTSGVLKNAIDIGGKGFFHKPCSFASYGGFAGGARAVEHLRGIMGEMRSYDLREQFVLTNFSAKRGADGSYPFGADETAAATLVLDQLIFWSRHMKPAREELLAAV